MLSYTLPRRCVVVTPALMVLLLIPSPAASDPAPVPARVARDLDASAASTTTSKPPTASTVRFGQESGADPSNQVLPIVLAAILFLALLVPTSGFPHTHRHWHSR